MRSEPSGRAAKVLVHELKDALHRSEEGRVVLWIVSLELGPVDENCATCPGDRAYGIDDRVWPTV